MDSETTRKVVQDYYGKEIHATSELKTQACCTSENMKMPPKIKSILSQISDDVATKYYGCGLTIPNELEGAHVLDLGCGAGRDCFLLSALVGSKGRVVGVDMTPEQLEVANRNIDYHRKQFGYLKSNVEYYQGLLEKLDEIPALKENTFDVIVSNCVINLVKDKQSVLNHVYRLLKPGGEFYFSDVYADRRVPEKLQTDPILWGECISGALYTRDFIAMAKKAGFADPRLVSSAPINLGNPKIESLVAPIKFTSSVYRLFKIPQFDVTGCEDYGQAVTYRGTIETDPSKFVLDSGHVFETGKQARVCRNTNLMLQATRFAKHFEFVGDESVHLGPYAECGTGSSDDCCSGDSCCSPSSSAVDSCCATDSSCCAPTSQTTQDDSCCSPSSGCCLNEPLIPLPEPAETSACCGAGDSCGPKAPQKVEAKSCCDTPCAACQ